MSIESVREYLSKHAPDLAIIEKPNSTSTVAEAAQAHGVARGQIAKTLALWLRDEVILLVLRGDAKIDNQKFKAQFKCKAKMLDADEVVEWTSHPVGGVCPFGLPRELKVFADVTLKKFDVVLPAAGATNTAMQVAPDRLVQLVGADWVDVAQVEA
jgi:prolyl-tRNA editing enzyme YbaK/EbsC (Cys-tRNA(Pro) deacylase)